MAIRKIKPKTFDDIFEGKPSKKKVYPKIRFSLKDLPEAKDWEIGKEYFLKLQIKQVGLHIGDGFDGAVFELRAIDAEQDSKNTHNTHEKKVRRYN